MKQYWKKGRSYEETAPLDEMVYERFQHYRNLMSTSDAERFGRPLEVINEIVRSVIW